MPSEMRCVGVKRNVTEHTVESRVEREMSNRCNACGVLFTDHNGIQGTCQDNLKLRAALVALVGMLREERQFAESLAVRNAERVLDGNEGEG